MQFKFWSLMFLGIALVGIASLPAAEPVFGTHDVAYSEVPPPPRVVASEVQSDSCAVSQTQKSGCAASAENWTTCVGAVRVYRAKPRYTFMGLILSSSSCSGATFALGADESDDDSDSDSDSDSDD